VTTSQADPSSHLTVADATEWRAWLDQHEHTSNGVWVTLAKKGTTTPTSLSYAEALDEALCSGWIDGRKHAIDTATFRQHFTPRRARSMWSKRNVDHVTRLIETGRMRERGLMEIQRAKADGRWDRAYEGAAAITVPPDLQAALAANPDAATAFERLSSAERYPILLKIVTAPTPSVRESRIARQVQRLSTAQRQA